MGDAICKRSGLQNFLEVCIYNWRHFTGINVLDLGFTKDFVGIDFRGLDLHKYFVSIKFRGCLKENFSMTLFCGLEDDFSKNENFFA